MTINLSKQLLVWLIAIYISHSENFNSKKINENCIIHICSCICAFSSKLIAKVEQFLSALFRWARICSATIRHGQKFVPHSNAHTLLIYSYTSKLSGIFLVCLQMIWSFVQPNVTTESLRNARFTTAI